MRIILINCLIYNFLVVTTLLWLLKKNPRYMMQDYPKEITKNIKEKSQKEKKESLVFGLPFTISLLLYPLFFGMYGKFIIEYKFIENWLSIFFIVLSFNLVDLVILDWFLFCMITPKFFIIPGTEGNSGYKNYWFHFIGFLKGCVILIIGSILIALLIEGIGIFIK